MTEKKTVEQAMLELKDAQAAVDAAKEDLQGAEAENPNCAELVQ